MAYGVFKLNQQPTQFKIALDTNIFHNRNFIAYLILHKHKFQIFLPTIVQIETGFFYVLRGLTWMDFQKNIAEFNGMAIEWKSKFTPNLLEFAYKNKSDLPFKHHFRDFMIGTQCEALELDLITYNVKHFQWVPHIKLFTPEQFVQKTYGENRNLRNQD